MSHKPLPWPYFAAEVRDLNAEDMQLIIKYQRRIQTLVNDGEVIRLAMLTLDAAQTSLCRSVKVGARVLPPRDL